ncbi:MULTISPECIES: DUF305 domain-containing protein [unclassified Sphingomonas]|uniref:DUF305 domain-containing protein n=1 Tax=unclassified Sphingomonas TaxID=196159 RepID=UPI0006F5406D|nr:MULTISPECIES: DUF305 domain-containing protein [unclassified Sphingomonas]KQM57291.1 hypothetical protein ASE65_13320 [Sphingomonas sp. Leaf16]KQN10466.1 hypothetical protein ASE81_13365 [Sphingomonas sp. Leaf29]KQN18267.1 hypothetical protein ASE83_13300 [Sphingomonas sp. Leaf32]
MKAPATILTLALLAACSQQPTGANTAESHDAMSHDAMMTATADDSEATRGYKQSMADMMTKAPPYSGDADIDFMQQMRVHHVAAVAMARTELAHGKDAEARALAQAVIDAQQKEIEQIDRWLRAKAR